MLDIQEDRVRELEKQLVTIKNKYYDKVEKYNFTNDIAESYLERYMQIVELINRTFNN